MWDVVSLVLEDSATSLDSVEIIYELNYLHPLQRQQLLELWSLLSHSMVHLREYVSVLLWQNCHVALTYLPKENLHPHLNPCLRLKVRVILG